MFGVNMDYKDLKVGLLLNHSWLDDPFICIAKSDSFFSVVRLSSGVRYDLSPSCSPYFILLPKSLSRSNPTKDNHFVQLTFDDLKGGDLDG